MRFRPTADVLEDRRLMSFGGGNIDPSIPHYPSNSPGLNFTSNSYHQINAAIPAVASAILQNQATTNAQLANYVAHIPYGMSSFLPILAADVAKLEQGGTTTTPATASSIVTTLYEELLDRMPDALGLSANTQALENGASIAQVADVIVQSGEFIQSNITAGASGLDNQVQFVSALYQDVLGRSADMGGLTYWLDQFNHAGLSLQQVAHDFVYSSEATTSSVSIIHALESTPIYSLYANLLGRSPTTAELDAGVQALENGISVAQVADVIVQSGEFTQNNITAGASGLDNEVQVVSALYFGVLGRDPDTAGLTYWLNQINNSGLSFQQVAHDFVYSSEASTSPSGILQKATYPATATSTNYYFGSVVPSVPITGNFAGTSATAQLENLIQKDTLAYLANGIGKSFNILKSGVGWASDSLLTYNGRV